MLLAMTKLYRYFDRFINGVPMTFAYVFLLLSYPITAIGEIEKSNKSPVDCEVMNIKYFIN